MARLTYGELQEVNGALYLHLEGDDGQRVVFEVEDDFFDSDEWNV